jgi:hypothetical protein
MVAGAKGNRRQPLRLEDVGVEAGADFLQFAVLAGAPGGPDERANDPFAPPQAKGFRFDRRAEIDRSDQALPAPLLRGELGVRTLLSSFKAMSEPRDHRCSVSHFMPGQIGRSTHYHMFANPIVFYAGMLSTQPGQNFFPHSVEYFPVAMVTTDQVLPISPAHHVIDRTLILHSRFSGHS